MISVLTLFFAKWQKWFSTRRVSAVAQRRLLYERVHKTSHTRRTQFGRSLGEAKVVLAWISSDCFESFSILSNVVTEGVITTRINRMKFRLRLFTIYKQVAENILFESKWYTTFWAVPREQRLFRDEIYPEFCLRFPKLWTDRFAHVNGIQP